MHSEARVNQLPERQRRNSRECLVSLSPFPCCLLSRDISITIFVIQIWCNTDFCYIHFHAIRRAWLQILAFLCLPWRHCYHFKIILKCCEKSGSNIVGWGTVISFPHAFPTTEEAGGHLGIWKDRREQEYFKAGRRNKCCRPSQHQTIMTFLNHFKIAVMFTRRTCHI